MEIKFSKIGEIKYISHLDLMRLFQRALRRARLPVLVTKGYNPHFKISIKRALKLGVESDEETAYFSFEKNIEPSELVDAVNKQLPAGVRVLSAKPETPHLRAGNV